MASIPEFERAYGIVNLASSDTEHLRLDVEHER